MWNFDDQFRKKTEFLYATVSKEKRPCKNQIRIQNMHQQFKYEQLHISAKTTDKTTEILTTNDIQITAELSTPMDKT